MRSLPSSHPVTFVCAVVSFHPVCQEFVTFLKGENNYYEFSRDLSSVIHQLWMLPFVHLIILRKQECETKHQTDTNQKSLTEVLMK